MQYESAMRSGGRRMENADVERIDRKVTEIMQKYCTPIHPSASHYEQKVGGRYSALDRVSNNLSQMFDDDQRRSTINSNHNQGLDKIEKRTRNK